VVPDQQGGGRYGPALAARVADFLAGGGMIASAHGQARGTGLGFLEGRFIYDEVSDGRFRCLEGRAPLAAFDDRQAFVSWLAQQSDDSLGGRERGGAGDEQRLTLARLEEALRRPFAAS
jgi:hypothetical protein